MNIGKIQLWGINKNVIKHTQNKIISLLYTSKGKLITLYSEKKSSLAMETKLKKNFDSYTLTF